MYSCVFAVVLCTAVCVFSCVCLFTYTQLCVCLCVRSCICVVCLCTQVDVCVCNQSRISFLRKLASWVLRQYLSPGPGSHQLGQAGWPESHRYSLFPHLCLWDYEYPFPFLVFKWARGLNAGPHACVPNTSAREMSPESHHISDLWQLHLVLCLFVMWIILAV